MFPYFLDMALLAIIAILSFVGIDSSLAFWILTVALSIEIANYNLSMVLGIQACFPNSVQGTISAILNFGTLLGFVQLPVVKLVKTDFEAGWKLYSYCLLGLFVLYCLVQWMLGAFSIFYLFSDFSPELIESDKRIDRI